LGRLEGILSRGNSLLGVGIALLGGNDRLLIGGPSCHRTLNLRFSLVARCASRSGLGTRLFHLIQCGCGSYAFLPSSAGYFGPLRIQSGFRLIDRGLGALLLILKCALRLRHHA
jgi:hypothetical protein